MNLAISIINYNSKELLMKLLKQIKTQTIPSSKIYVVDNNSPDDFCKLVPKEFPTIQCIQRDKNEGFAKGQNVVLKQINTKYALILNPDTDLPDHSIQKMVSFMDEYQNCGVASCRIIGYDGSLHSNGGNFPFGLSLLVWLFNLEMIPFIGSKLQNFHRIDEEYYQKLREVDWVGGTFMIARVEVLKAVNYFNEKYFMYFEDTDFCYKVKKKGKKVMFNPEVTIKHKSGGSTDDPQFNQFKGELVGLKIFYGQYGNFFEKLLITPLIYLSMIARVFAFFIVGKGATSKTYLRIFKYV